MKGGLAQLDLIGTNQWKRPIYYTSGGFDGSLGLENFYRTDGLAYRLVPVETRYQSLLEMGDIDTGILYDKLMNTYQWGRMEQVDVMLDYYTIRTLLVIRFRSLYTRLAIRLLQEGDKERAIGVLDHCMTLAPGHKVPYDQYISGITIPDGKGGLIHHEGIIEAYYQCEETGKANAILEDHYRILADELAFYSAMKPRLRNSIQREINEAVFQMEELEILLRQYGQTELMTKLGIQG
jgi:hypothetical protein